MSRFAGNFSLGHANFEMTVDRGKAQKYLTSAAAKAQEFRTDITKYTLPVLISPVA